MITNRLFRAGHGLSLLGITLCLLALSGYRLAAQCLTAGLDVSTGRTSTGWQAQGANDPKWICWNKTGDYAGSLPATGSPALVVVPTGTWFVGTATSGRWICDNQANANGINVTVNSSMTFQREFRLCSAAQIQINLNTHSDGFVSSVAVDGTPGWSYSTPNVSTWQVASTTQAHVFTVSLGPGVHNLRVVLENWPHASTNPAGLMVQGSLTASSPVLVDDNNPSCVKYACGTPPTDCAETCFWKLTGNSIASGRNIFGTMTADPVRIHTSGIPVGIITTGGQFGFGNMVPGNTVEITNSGRGSSGLRFTNMTSADSAVPNASGKVLSVNGSGDVILVTGGSGGGGSVTANNGVSMSGGAVQLGQNCQEGSGAALTSDRAIPMNNHNLIFRDAQSLQANMNRVGIGTSGCLPTAKLDVLRNPENSVYDANNIAISGVNRDLSTYTAKGVYGEASADQNQVNIGGDFSGQNGQQSTIGVRGDGQAQGGQEAYGGYFTACGAQRNIGIFASVCNPHAPNFAGDFAGDVLINGMFYPSDKNIKQNVEPITGALEILQRIEPKTYQFKTGVYPGLNLPANTTQYGVISQELETVLPTLVKEAPVPDGKNGFLNETIKTVNYTALIPILIQAVKDQQAQIQEQQKSIAMLLERVSENAAKQDVRDNTVANLSVLLTDKDLAVIAQNEPNPFDRETVIAYYLPQSVKTAAVQFSNVEGKVIKTLQISARGKGVLNVYGSELSTGIYTYTLIADGVVIDTKKMQILR